MKKKITDLLAIASVFAVSLVSCGTDEPEDNTVPDLPVLSTEAETTEAVTENETEEKTEAPTEKETVAEETTEEVTDEATEAAETTDAPTVEPEPDEPQEEQPQEPEPVPEPQEVKFSFGTLHSEANSIVSSLGDALNVTTAPACFTNGADSKIYEYDGLRIECYVLDGVEKICCVTITSSKYTTDTGIMIGSSQADVEAAYGAGDEIGGYIIYYSGSNELDVKYNNGVVTEITFYTAV